MTPVVGHRPLRLACAGFSESDLDSLRGTLARLGPYLRASWELIDDPRDADLCLVSLDTGSAPAGGARRVGCAARPREFPKGTLYRPLRVPQLLAVLSETSRAFAEGDGPEAAPVQPARDIQAGPPLRLLAWPLDLDGASRLRLHVLAVLTFAPASVGTLAARIGEDAAAVASEIEALRREGLVEQVAGEAPAAPRPAPPQASWRGLVRGLGRRLGFSL